MVGKVGFCNTDGIDDQLHLSLLNGPCIARDDPTEGIASACSLRTQGFPKFSRSSTARHHQQACVDAPQAGMMLSRSVAEMDGSRLHDECTGLQPRR